VTSALDPLPRESARIAAILERRGQVILFWSTGTGKTYWAQRTVCELAARKAFDKSYSHLSPGERDQVNGEPPGGAPLVRSINLIPPRPEKGANTICRTPCELLTRKRSLCPIGFAGPRWTK